MTQTMLKPAAPTEVFARRSRLRVGVFVSLGVLLGVAFILSLALGQYYVALGDLVQIMAAGPGGGLTANVVWQIRLPRILLGFLAVSYTHLTLPAKA